MPTSANITTAGVTAFTLPVGAWGVRVINESDTLIRRLLGQPAATSGARLGLPLAAGAGETLVFKQPLKQAVSYCAIHAGSGDKTLTYEIITQPTQGGTGPSSSAGGGASNALLLAGVSSAALGSLTAATEATGGIFYGTQGGADRKFTLTAVGAALAEASTEADQLTALGAAGLASANAFTANGAAGTPAFSLTGSLFTGGSSTSTKPLQLIEPAGTTSTGWSTEGTLLGVNAPNGFAGSLLDLQANGVSKFGINSGGNIQPGSDRGIQFLTQNGTWLATLGTNGDPQINMGVLGIYYARGKWDNSGLWVAQNRYIAFTDSEQGGAVDTRLYRTEVAVLAVRGGATSTGGAIELLEQTAPAAGVANTVRIYAVDNGAGKTQLMALFASGAAQQIAIQP